MNKIITLLLATSLSFNVWGEEEEKIQDQKLTNIPVSNVLDQSPLKTDKKFSLELFSYEDYIYSKSRKTEVGDNIRLVSRFRYQIDDQAWASFGFRTDPDRDRFDNKTTDFEIRSGYVYGNLVAQADFSLNTNDQDGEFSFGFDLDSENTFLRYAFNSTYQLTFFPFNFNGEVGVNFRTDDITRIYYVTGTPGTIPNQLTSTNAESLAQKTIPGLEFRYNKAKSSNHITSAYVGMGLTTYEFPNDPNFDITVGVTNNLWSRREVFAYKFGFLLRRPNTFTSLQFVGQTKDDETGVLLSSAASFYSLSQFGRFIGEFELTATEGGSKAYRVSRDGKWFDRSNTSLQNTSHRIYSDLNGNNPQDWLGKWGYGASLKLGFVKNQNFRPYFSYRFQDKNFVYRSRTSAHRLRTANFSQSHGGLNRIGFGAYIYKGNFIINPSFEYLSASNNVFNKSSSLEEFSITRSLNQDDFSLFVNVSYFFNKRKGPRTFRL